jgi:hypothetical protein
LAVRPKIMAIFPVIPALRIRISATVARRFIKKARRFCRKTGKVRLKNQIFYENNMYVSSCVCYRRTGTYPPFACMFRLCFNSLR